MLARIIFLTLLCSTRFVQEGKGPGPIPPASESLGAFQRFKNIYCNANRPYQPDLVLDIKLYGKRS